MIALLMLAGCWKQSGEAVVVGKDYIPAIEINEMPNESPLPETTPEGSTPANTPDTDEEEDYAYVDPMGPPMDPRALKHEQWIVRVQMVVDRRQMDVRLEPARWETLKQGDRVHVTHHQGRDTPVRSGILRSNRHAFSRAAAGSDSPGGASF